MSSAGAAAGAAPSTTVGSQVGQADGAAPGSPSEVLADAARLIEAAKPWYETLGLRFEQAADAGGDVAVEAVLAFNVTSGLIDAASKTVLAPVFVLLKGLLSAAQGAAAAREEILELIQYCVGISRCLLEAAKAKDMPSSIVATLGKFEGEIDAVGQFVQTYGTRSGGCCRKMVVNSHDRDTAAYHKRKLKDLLDAVLAGLALQTHVGVNEIKDMITARDPPRLPPQAEIPRGAPILPATYVQRTTLLEKVVEDLTDPQRSATVTHCLLGMGGGGKTLMASSVVRDHRVRVSYRDGMFWVSVGSEGKDTAGFLEYVAVELSRVPTNTPHSCPHRFEGAEEVVRHLSAVLEKNSLRCLVVLDNVWSVEVVDAFASTGFHVLVTTRQRTVISPAHSCLCTEVGDMSEGDALEVLRKASGAHGPVPAEAAREVARDCGFLPLVLGMVGTLAKGQPLDPSSWREVHETLRDTHTKFVDMENGKLFSAISTSVCALPLAQLQQLRLLAVLASGGVATIEMLANLWDQDTSDVPTGTTVLVNRCLLQKMPGGYRTHDLVIEYLQRFIMRGDQSLVKTATSRQARYLGRLDVFNGYATRGDYASTGGSYSLVALWNALKKLDGTVDAGPYYMKSLKGVMDMATWRKGDYSSAETVLTEASGAVDDQGDGSLEAAAMLGTLASALREQGKLGEADALLLRAIGIEEKALGPDHPELARSLNNRANVLEKQGKLGEADALHVRAIGIKEKALGPDHPELARSLNNRANVLEKQGKLGEADALHLRAIGIKEKVLGPDHPELAISLGNRAVVLREQGKLGEADALHLRAIGIKEKALGPDHPELARSLNNRANVLEKQGKLEEADALHLRAIGIQEKALGPDHPELAMSLGNRANVLRKQGKLGEADALHLRAIGIKEKALGPDHPELAISLGNRANVLQAQGKLGEADALQLRAIGIFEKALGPDHPSLARSLGNRANVLQKQGKLGEADALHLRAIGIKEKGLGPDHPELAKSLGNRANVLKNQGKLGEADALHLRAIGIKEKALGPDHPELAASLGNRANVLMAQGKLGEADALHLRAIGIEEKALGPDHPSLAISLGNRAVVLEKQGKLGEADALHLRAIGIEEKALGPDHPSLAMSLGNRAVVLEKQGKLGEADALHLRAIGIEEKALGPDHPELAISLFNRATMLMAQGNHDEARPLLERALAIFRAKLGEAHSHTVLALKKVEQLNQRQQATGPASTSGAGSE